MHLMLISGSLRAGSSHTAALRTLQTLAPDGVGTDFFEGLAALPHFNPDDDTEDKISHSAVRDLRERLGKADGVLLSTPEYAGALPGAFKNLL
jgi:chromate reductase